ncbi:hypothetical protein V8C44DRAFT_313914, partial [Trichoderma aethiopicum]
MASLINAKCLRLSRHAASQLAKTVTAHEVGVISAEQSSPAPVLSFRLVSPAQPRPRSRALFGGPSISWARDEARTAALTAASDAALDGRPAASPCIRLPGPRHRCFAPSDGFPCPPPARPVTPPLLAVSGGNGLLHLGSYIPPCQDQQYENAGRCCIGRGNRQQLAVAQSHTEAFSMPVSRQGLCCLLRLLRGRIRWARKLCISASIVLGHGAKDWLCL